MDKSWYRGNILARGRFSGSWHGILGTELSVRSLTVRLLEQNEDYAAIADELLTGDIKIVTESDKELSNGIAVKEWGEN